MPDITHGNNWSSMITEFAGESDRAAAIVGCALLDERLAEVLKAFLVQNTDESANLFNSENSNAPLGTFGSRILTAYVVGIIKQSQRDALRKLKKIRNLFAHNIDAGFTDQGIVRLCVEIDKLCETEDDVTKASSSREQFQRAVAYLAGTIRTTQGLVIEFGLKGCMDSILHATFTGARDISDYEKWLTNHSSWFLLASKAGTGKKPLSSGVMRINESVV